jgi:hypothetical protein
VIDSVIEPSFHRRSAQAAEQLHVVPGSHFRITDSCAFSFGQLLGLRCPFLRHDLVIPQLPLPKPYQRLLHPQTPAVIATTIIDTHVQVVIHVVTAIPKDMASQPLLRHASQVTKESQRSDEHSLLHRLKTELAADVLSRNALLQVQHPTAEDNLDTL